MSELTTRLRAIAVASANVSVNGHPLPELATAAADLIEQLEREAETARALCSRAGGCLPRRALRDIEIVSYGPVLYPPHPDWKSQSVTPVKGSEDSDE